LPPCLGTAQSALGKEHAVARLLLEATNVLCACAEEGTRVVHAAIAFGAGAGPLPDDPVGPLASPTSSSSSSSAAGAVSEAPNLTLCAPVGPAALKRVRDAVHALRYAQSDATYRTCFK
jgi:hypothetical protein